MKGKFLGLTLAITALFALASCDNGNNATSSSTDVPSTTPTTNVPTTEPTTETPTLDWNYSVKVEYPDGTAAAGVGIQWCNTDGNCFLPVDTEENGFAYKKLENAMYYIHIDSGMPEGYTYNPNIYTATATNTNVVINLIELNEITSGEGTQQSPYVVTEGAYRYTATYTRQGIFYSFTPATSGTYVVESLAKDDDAYKLDPALVDYKDSDTIKGQKTDGGIGDNFKYTMQLEANTTYTIMLYISESSELPSAAPSDPATAKTQSFDFVLSKSA